MSDTTEPKRQRRPLAPIKPLYVETDQAPHVVRLSSSVIDLLERTGQFPKRRQLSGRRVGYLLRELEEWAESRPVSELAPGPGRRATQGEPTGA